MLEIFFQLLIGHALADFALQTPNVALGKNRQAGPPPGYDEAVHGKRQPIWVMVMAAHCLVHAGAVLIITGSTTLALVQFASHYLIDFLKCDRHYNVWVDQLLHVLVIAWIAVVSV